MFVTLFDPETGQVLATPEYRNLVVTVGKKTIARLLGGDGNYHGLEEISKIGFGTDGTAAAVGNAALGAQQFSKACSVTYPADNQVQFSVTMLSSEGGSHPYRELGLLTKTSDYLFSRVVIGAIVKTSAIAIKVDWLISIQ